MARPKSVTRKFTAGEALYVVQRLIRDRRIKESEAARIADEMPGEIAELERRLAELRSADGSRGTSSPTRRGRQARGGAPRKRRSGPVSPETIASRRLQGEYMGLLRQFSGRARARMKAIAKEGGREAAIKEMRAARPG